MRGFREGELINIENTIFIVLWSVETYRQDIIKEILDEKSFF